MDGRNKSGHDGWEQRPRLSDAPLTFVPLSGTDQRIISPGKRTASRRQIAAAGREAEPAGGACYLAPGRSGHHARRHYDRRARCVAGSGSARRRDTPAPFDGSCHEAWPGSHQGTTTPLGKSRGGTPEGELPPPRPSRADEGRGGGSAALQMVCADFAQTVCARCGGCGPAFSGVPYSFFCETEKAKRNTEAPPLGLFFAPVSRFTSLKSGGSQAKARAATEKVCRHPEVPARSAGLEGCGSGAGAVALRGSLRSHLRVTEEAQAKRRPAHRASRSPLPAFAGRDETKEMP